ncbi:hypothetical protein MHU86_14237 [Fragilaria crotonensis]|nr:hypothetical protein MHU86_14237 [Fragilaria crotonensis]
MWKKGGARVGKGDYGKMYPIGHHAKGFEMKQYAAPSHPSDIPKLQKAVTAAYKLASVTVPAVVQVIQDLKDDAAVPRLAGMHGEKGEVKRIEGRRGFSVWTEDFPNSNKTWYFVLPNLRGQFPDSDREYQGVAIKLAHGVLISWDGRVVRHCTSVRDKPNRDVCGTFFAAKTRVVRQGMHKAHQDRVRARLPAWLLEDNKEMAHEDVAVCENESAEVLDTPPDVSVDGNAEVSVSSALKISEDEDADADDMGYQSQARLNILWEMTPMKVFAYLNL